MLKRLVFRSILGYPIARFVLATTRYEVFSPWTSRLMELDTLRLQARRRMAGASPTPPHRQLHLGCGKRIVPGWLNVDVVDSECDVDLACGRLPWADNSFDAIVSQHVLEHLELFCEVLPLLNELKRVSRPGAVIWLTVPDMDKVCRSYTDHGGHDLYDSMRNRFPALADWQECRSHVVNSLFHQDGEHKNLFDFDLMQWACKKVGLANCERRQERDLLRQFPDFPPRGDDDHALYVCVHTPSERHDAR